MKNALRGKMAEYGLTISDLAKIAGVSYQAMSNKLHGRTEFTVAEAKKILRYFNSQEGNLTFESLFLAYLSTNEDNKKIVGD